MNLIRSALASSARELALREGLSASDAIDKSLDILIESSPNLAGAESHMRTEAQNNLLGFGSLQDLIDDESIEEIWINSPTQIFFARSGVAHSAGLQLSSEEVAAIIERMLRPTGRRLDRSSPFVDASLADGSRLHVVIPDITKAAWAVNIRKFPWQLLTLQKLCLLGALTQEQLQYLSKAVQAGKNILVSGATQAGKTTILCALLAEANQTDRIVSVEETFELRVQQPDWVALQTRQPNLEGVGEVSLRRLIKEALRMRPTRLVVGEVREAESLDLLIALNSGLPGACTIHANSAAEAIAKLCTLPLLAGQNISSDFVNPTVGNCIDVVVHCEMNSTGARRIKEICEVEWNAQSQQIDLSKVEFKS
ncbi:ATPase, T2SS/T4P/T4SS family [Rhodoluna sp.]|uniref:CpaF family protein n=1 Tax=Rhodoluna sp. TaxID=1969481 RepID=UPI0025E8CCCE|nr:ATPase, T2SS/T4P/T4SS family [Rhodoluna sp.]